MFIYRGDCLLSCHLVPGVKVIPWRIGLFPFSSSGRWGRIFFFGKHYHFRKFTLENKVCGGSKQLNPQLCVGSLWFWETKIILLPSLGKKNPSFFCLQWFLPKQSYLAPSVSSHMHSNVTFSVRVSVISYLNFHISISTF